MRPTSFLLALALLASTSFARADDAPGEEKRMASAPMLATGISLMATGTLVLPVGLVMLAIGEPQPMCAGCSIDYTGRHLAELGFLAGGASVILAGIPLVVLGARRVPVTVGLGGPDRSLGFTLAGRF
jgi:hypothetical protein